ncbi:phosphohistidine phosphatase SixA [Thorsellia kenyensis]|uniref:Phosphohistidine phosphatase SixA n=1 Tax=Thorsellia kenyensis TaxID=1549888 RepID=A0ABV6CBI8_9GAMM
MNIIVMRHGEAINQAPTDSSRPLSPYGEEQSSQVGAWLAQEDLCPTHVWVSPYLRTIQTWEKVQQAMESRIEATILETITPNGSAQRVVQSIYEFIDSLYKHTPPLSLDEVNLMIISHLPLVGYLVEELCPNEHSPIMFQPANIAGIRLNNEGQGELLWHGGLIKE